jgi:hypothetical protein
LSTFAGITILVSVLVAVSANGYLFCAALAGLGAFLYWSRRRNPP